MELSDLLTLGGASIIVVIVTEVIKRAANLSAEANARFGPLLAVFVGVVACVAAAASTASDLGQAALTGLLAGASAAGIYSFTKANATN